MSAPAQPSSTITGLPDHAIEVKGLTKRYRASGRQAEKLALDNVDLAIPRGSVFGLLGPNGAGKSTFINILAGLVIKTSGTAKIWGTDIDEDERAAKASIGIVPQELNIDPFFTPRELLDIQAGMYGVRKSERRTEDILGRIGLLDKAEAYARTLSGGMRRRLLVGKAMVHNPPVLVLDEPTAGVDIELRQKLWENVMDLNRRGTTILLTTHYLEEAEELCDRIAIINHGKVVANDDTRRLLRRLDSKGLKFVVEGKVTEVPEALSAFNVEIGNGEGETSELVIHYPPSRIKAGELISAVNAAGLTILDLSTQETDLEDIFLQLTSSKAA